MSHYRPRDGKDGLPGLDGKDGLRGERGPQGEKGDTGEQGPDGEQGPQGEPGEKGPKGDRGPKGKKGDKGDRGSDGSDGEDGSRGPMGPMPDHQWRDTSLRFQEPDGDWGRYVNLKGEKGDQGFPGGSGGRGPKGDKGDPGDAANLIEGVNIDLFTDSSGTQVSMPAAGDGSAARKPIQYNADALDTLGADAGFTYEPSTKLIENEGPASLRSITDTAVLGPELTTNGTFTGSAAGWTLGAGWSYVANNVALTNPGAGTLSQNITVSAGTPYLVSWSHQHSLANNVSLTPTIGAASGVPVIYGNTAANTQSQVIVPVASGSLALTFTPAGGTSGTLTVDTVSVVAITTVPLTIELENAAGATVNEHRAFSSNSNISIGLQSGRNIVSSTNATLYGLQSGTSLTTAANLTAVGRESGRSVTTGANNTFAGMGAGQSTTTGDSNTAVGVQAAFNNVTGAANSFFGRDAGRSNTSGGSNNFFGLQAGNNNTTGSNNNFYGQQAGSNNTTGSGNTFFGFQAGRFHADGVTPLTDPEQSVYIGRETRGFDNNDNNSIVVGFSAIGRGANTAQWGNTSILNHYFSGSIQNTGRVLVAAKSGFPAPVAGVITLANNTRYDLTGAIDLTGDRIVCGTNNCISGNSLASSSLVSTGLAGGSALITSTSSVQFENIGLSAPTGSLFNLNDSTGDLLLTGVNITNTPTIGTTQNYGNIVIENTKVIASANWTITGTIGSLAMFRVLLNGLAGQSSLIVPSAAIVTRRISLLYCAIDTPATGTGLNVSTTATIADESYNLDNCVFTSAGAPLAGLDYTSNKSLFYNNSGITNTSVICQYSMTGNSTATVIAATGTFVKIAGTTTASSLNQKFTTATTQRATYAGVIADQFRVSAVASMTSGNNQTIRMRVAKNGTTIAESQSNFKTTGSGDASAIFCQTFVSLTPADYIEIFVANDTATTNITVSDLNVNVVRM